jgi:hypothetical protein
MKRGEEIARLRDQLEKAKEALAYHDRAIRECDYDDERRSVRITTIKLLRAALEECP